MILKKNMPFQKAQECLKSSLYDIRQKKTSMVFMIKIFYLQHRKKKLIQDPSVICNYTERTNFTGPTPGASGL